MRQVDREIERYLALLGEKVRERGFTQLDVQETLGWGRSYISQLVTKQKALRFDQVLMILSVIEVEPTDFFAELYQPRSASSAVAEMSQKLPRLRSYISAVGKLLVGKGLISAEEYSSIVNASGD